MKQSWIPVITVVLLFVLFRLLTASHIEYANFTPLAAMLFCGAAYWNKNKWVLPAVALTWLITTPLVSALQGYTLWHMANVVMLIAVASVVLIGFQFTGKSWIRFMLGSLFGAIAFYGISNTLAFVIDPLYAKTWEGYVQCMWTGYPGSTMPTWVFFRNSLIGNAVGTGSFLAVIHLALTKKTARQAA